jgi:hypothetical protein
MVVVGTLIAFVVVWRRPLLPTAWVFLGFASVSGLSVLSTLLPHLLEGRRHGSSHGFGSTDLITALYPAVFLHFMVMLPRQPWAPGRGRRSPWFWLVAGGYLVPVAFWGLRPWVSHAPWPWPGQGYASAVTVIGVALLIVRYLRPEPGWAPTLGQRFIAILVGVTMVTSNLVFGDPRFDGWLEAFLVVPWQRVAFTVLLTAWLATPLLLAYLIADEPTFNPRRLFTDGLGYLVLSTLVATVYLVAVVVLQRLFADVAGENVFVLDLIAAIVLALLFAPLREFVQRTLDRVFDRDPTALRAAFDAAGARLLAALDRDEVRLAVETGIAQGLRRPVAVGWSEQGTPSLRDPERVPDFARGPARGAAPAGDGATRQPAPDRRARGRDPGRAARAAVAGAAALPVQRAQCPRLSHRGGSLGGAALHRATRRHDAVHGGRRPARGRAAVRGDRVRRGLPRRRARAVRESARVPLRG